MTKQIDFNPELIGKEGITVKYRNGETPDFVKVYRDMETCNKIISIEPCGGVVLADLNGKAGGDTCMINLLMFQEVLEMTGEEWVKYEYPSAFNGTTFSNNDMANAFDAGKAHAREIDQDLTHQIKTNEKTS